jgi:hypothetical protein
MVRSDPGYHISPHQTGAPQQSESAQNHARYKIAQDMQRDWLAGDRQKRGRLLHGPRKAATGGMGGAGTRTT